jgi:hypothetical protein
VVKEFVSELTGTSFTPANVMVDDAIDVTFETEDFSRAETSKMF